MNFCGPDECTPLLAQFVVGIHHISLASQAESCYLAMGLGLVNIALG